MTVRPILAPCHKNTLEETNNGLTVIAQHFEALDRFVPADFDMGDLIDLREWLDRVIRELKKADISKTLGLINQDILGAYYFNQGHVEIYWMAIGIVAVLQGISVAALTAVVLAHELAHAYTHLGKDIDGKKWDTNLFRQADLKIVEGLAQFYTEVVCKKLETRFPAALDAYEKLLAMQSEPYRVQVTWAENSDHKREVIRFSMVNARTSKITGYETFKEFLDSQAGKIGRKQYK